MTYLTGRAYLTSGWPDIEVSVLEDEDRREGVLLTLATIVFCEPLMSSGGSLCFKVPVSALASSSILQFK